MSTVTKTLYETDFVEWADRTAELLRQGKFDEVDMEHGVEEVEGLAQSDRHAVRLQLLRMLMHLIKEGVSGIELANVDHQRATGNPFQARRFAESAALLAENHGRNLPAGRQGRSG